MDSARGTLHKIIAETIRRLPPQEAVMTAWAFVCGAAVAERTKVLAYENGVLRVQVADAAWRAQLVSMRSQYINGLRTYTGQETEKIEFLLPEQAERWKAAKSQVAEQPR